MGMTIRFQRLGCSIAPFGAIVGQVNQIDCVATWPNWATAGPWFTAAARGTNWQVPPPVGSAERAFGDYTLAAGRTCTLMPGRWPRRSRRVDSSGYGTGKGLCNENIRRNCSIRLSPGWRCGFGQRCASACLALSAARPCARYNWRFVAVRVQSAGRCEQKHYDRQLGHAEPACRSRWAVADCRPAPRRPHLGCDRGALGHHPRAGRPGG